MAKLYRIGRWESGSGSYRSLGFFASKADMEGYRDKQVGTDNPSLEGTWSVYTIGPKKLSDFTLEYEHISTLEFIGQWIDGNTHRIIGHKTVGDDV